MKKPLIAVPLGDPAGIGPEIVAKSIADKELFQVADCIVIGDKKVVENAVRITGEDLTVQCKGPAVAVAVSDVADNVEVRKHLVAEQRRLGLAARPGAVMEGRDIGSVVFPDADIKFFITAPAEVRAHRRCLEFKENGKNVPEEEVLRSVLERDKRDRERPVGALIQLPEAIPLDTGDLTREEVTQKIVEHVNAARS